MTKKRLLKKVFTLSLAAVLGITSVISSPVTGEQKEAEAAVTGNLNRVWVHDPSIVADTKDGKETYYIFGSHISAAKSTDLANWTNFGNGYQLSGNALFGNLDSNLATPFLWAGKDDSDCKGGRAVWAPDVKYNPNYINDNGTKGAYMMYFCVSSTYCRSAIAYAVSDKIDGNYKYKGTLVYSGFTKKSAKDTNSNIDKQWENTNIDELMKADRIEEGVNSQWFMGDTGYNTMYAPNAIDPTIFTDTSGRMWMTYGSWSGGIFLLELDPKTGDAIYPGENGTTADGRVIDKYFGTHLAGGYGISGEGPYILYDAETKYYYLYTTYNYLDSVSGYNMRLFRSKNPDGPYVDAAGKSAVFASASVNQYDIGIKVMGNYNIVGGARGYRSPGHNSALIDGDGKRYLIYHTRFQTGGEGFETRVHQQFMNDQGWPVTAVYENRGDEISESGYEKKSIVGTYHFINHGTASDNENVNSGQRVILNEDGTITGEVTGTWSQKDNSYYATITIGGVEYHGVFFEQHNEKGSADPVMTFTAIGGNNKTIFGAKISDKTGEFEADGDAATDFSKLTVQPVLKYTFDDKKGIKKLAGSAVVEDGVLKLKADGTSKGVTYAELEGIGDKDFTKGITLTADVVVNQYVSDWTSLFMISDTELSAGKGSYPYRYTLGFSSIADLASGQVGYYGSDVRKPYSWDYFNDFSNRGKWYTITVVITSRRMSTFVNGVKVQTVKETDLTSLMEVFAKADHVYLGGSVFKAPDFAGWMDNVAIYEGALTDDAVRALVTSSKISEGTAEIIEGEEKRFKEISDTNTDQKDTSASSGNDSDSESGNPAAGTKLKDEDTGNQYKVKKEGAAVSFISPKNKKVKSLTIPATIELAGTTYRVTQIDSSACKKCVKLKKVTIGKNVDKIGLKAFYQCKALKKVIVKTTKLTKSGVGAKAFSGISKKAVIKVPKAKKKSYQKIFRAKGLNGKKQKVK